MLYKNSNSCSYHDCWHFCFFISRAPEEMEEKYYQFVNTKGNEESEIATYIK